MTWEDIKKIVNISDDIVLDKKEKFFENYPTEQLYYEEVLRRYESSNEGNN